MQSWKKLSAFFISWLLLFLPVSASAQLSQNLNTETNQSYNTEDIEPQLFCKSGEVNCGKFIGLCKKEWQCDDAIWCGIGYKYCWEEGLVENCAGGQLKCCSSSYPYYYGGSCYKCDQKSSYPNSCGNGCWSSCGSGSDFVCNNGKAECKSKCTDNDGDGYGSGCGKGSDCNDNDASAWKANSCGACAKEPSGLGNSCTAGTGACQKTGKYVCNNAGTGTACDAKAASPSTETCDGVDNDCDGQIDESVKNACGTCGTPPQEICNDNIDNNCDGTIDENCCSASKPYKYDGSCHACPKDEPKQCGSTCYSSTQCGSDVTSCDKNNQVICCASSFPTYCARTDNNGQDACWKSQQECNTAQKCGSEGWTVCRNTNFPSWNCRADGTSGCCPANYPHLWNSDQLCHTTQEQQKCSIPDGKSANCDCDTNADCPQNKPYCEQNYPSPISDGYDGCLTSPPQHCGDGTCNNGETYNTCSQDCTAPTGTIKADVYNPNTKSAVSGARISVDSVFKTTTDANGKASITASYGNRNVKVECPDSKLCGERTIKVDGEEYASFGCNCNPPGDTDGDGYSDADETLLGTDPMNAQNNYATTFTSDSANARICIGDVTAMLIKWKGLKDFDPEAATKKVITALNTTSVTAGSVKEQPYRIANAISNAELEAQFEPNAEATLEETITKSEYVSGFYTESGFVLIATDEETRTTTIKVIGATCVGVYFGALNGAGIGFVDDVKGLIEGIRFVITHIDDIPKIVTEADKILEEVGVLLKNWDKIVWDLFRDILTRARKGNPFYDNESYRGYQVGYVHGFLTGYLIEQVILIAIPITKVATMFKGGNLLKPLGKALSIEKKLDTIRKLEGSGEEVAAKLGKLKYLKEGIENWADSEIKGLARIMKHNEGWLKGLTEAEAKIAAKHADELAAAGKVTDEAFGDLTKTKLGQHTLKSADATTDLLTKQAKLVEKWGVKKADDVVTKGWFGSGIAERISDLNKILKAMPDNLIDDFTTDRAVKLLGKKGFGDAIDKAYKTFSEQDLSFAVKNIDSFDELGTGLSTLLNKGKKIENIVSGIPDSGKLRFFKNMAKISGKTADDVAEVSDVKGVHKLVDNIVNQPVSGFDFEAELAAKLKKSGKQLQELSKEIDLSAGKSEVDVLLKNGDIYSAKKVNWKAEQMKPGNDGYKTLTKELEHSIDVFRADNPSVKITIAFKGSVEPGIKLLLEQTQKVLVEVIP